ncbi:MAG: ABC transporter ATP-binding protein, partial [Pseudomonadota bacterium]
RFFLARAWAYRRDLGLICLVTLVSAGATLVVPWLAGQLLGGLLGEVDISVGQTLGLLLLALVSSAFLRIGVAILSATASGRILAGLRREAYDHIQSISVQSHEQSELGDLLSLVTSEVRILSNFLTTTLANIPSNLLTAAGAIVLLLFIDPVMALVLPLLVPVVILLNKLTARRLKALGRRARQAEVEVFSQAQSDLEMLSAIKSYAREEAYGLRYSEALEQARQATLSQARLSAFIGPIMGLVAALIAVGILVIGAAEVPGSEARSAGELLSFLLYAALLTAPASDFARIYGEYQLASGTLTRLSEVLELPAEDGYFVQSSPDKVEGALRFEGIHFSYPERDKVLDGLNLEIAAGEVVALTGPNGVGKSTLVRLLLRFYEPDSGRILLDGKDIREFNVQHLRRQIGYVPQRALLFNGTVKDNITMGASHAPQDAIIAASKLSGADDFVQVLPDGYDTLIGDQGVRLSGGQRQRIALARALFANPPIYVFDEATSMYDMPSEAAFVEACVNSLKGRTIIVITHRPATLALADRVLSASPTGYSLVSPEDLARSDRSKDADDEQVG